ncbi:PD-(D/E)XK nuclease family protein [Sphingomonas sp. MMS24-JH45]
MIAGTVDRLLVADDVVRLVDYKTGRQVPVDAGAVPPYHLAQMAAYRAALRVQFPGRRVDAALLYTAGPRLIELPDDLLDAVEPGFALDGAKLGGRPQYSRTSPP